MQINASTKTSLIIERDGIAQVLSTHHLDVLRCLLKGQSNQQIAAELCLARSTVKNYLWQLYGAFGVENRLQAALFALEHHILDQVSQ